MLMGPIQIRISLNEVPRCPSSLSTFFSPRTVKTPSWRNLDVALLKPGQLLRYQILLIGLLHIHTRSCTRGTKSRILIVVTAF